MIGKHFVHFQNAASPLAFLVLFVAAISIGVGQFRRGTSDEEHTIARYKRLLKPLTARRLQKIVFTGPPGMPEALPQARLAMAPCVLIDANVTPPALNTITDTSLVIWRKADDWRLRGKTALWYAEDDLNRYALLIPTAQ